MRGVRSLGLLFLFVGAQVVALLLALPYRSAGLASTSNPNSPLDPVFIIVAVVVAPLILLFFIARAQGALAAVRFVILVAIAGALYYTLQATFSLIVPAPFYFRPETVALVGDFSIPLAGAVASALFLALLMEPQWYVVDSVGFLAAGSLIALLGISFGILPSFILLIALAVYDAIAVYRTKHMVALADVATDLKLPILMVMPGSGGFDYTKRGRIRDQQAQPVEEREALFMGLGDVVIPGTLVTSAFVWLPTTSVLGVGANLWVALAVLAGAVVGYGILMRLVARGTAQAGLPLLNGGALLGYIFGYLLLFHNVGLGLTVSL
ncbi:MAG TPA: presenilin family intramembrane aspartyl protease PSH [Thermoplasmata archaeon]|nr:presenilin family intramembrane aspartyl protease PSH [Thermoplasmata archaeon]